MRQKILLLPREFCRFLIRVYQKIFSPDHGFLKVLFPGGYCRYTPSCSSYAEEAIKKYGVLKGGLKSLGRILRCNPFSKGGLDLP